jgi:periplasmic divalent cation tolerance protein
MTDTAKTEADAALRLIYTTWPNAGQAEACAEALLQVGLIACAHIQPMGRSLYQWQGKLERSDEVVMWVKTTRAKGSEAAAAIAAHHPYEVPAILALPVDLAGSWPAYLDWVRQAMTPEGR